MSKKDSYLKAAYTYLHQVWWKEGSYQSHLYDVALGTKQKLKLPEVFTSAVVLEVLFDSKLDLKVKQGLIEFVQSSSRNQDGLFSLFYNNRRPMPADVDTTALCVAILTQARAMCCHVGMQAVQKILNNTSPKGCIEIFFSQDPRWLVPEDHVICANALYLVYLYKQADKAERIEDHLYSTLKSERFLEGGFYYFSPDVFLLMIARLVHRFSELKQKFGACLKEKISLRIGSTETPLDLAMRIIASKVVDLPNEREIDALISLQMEDGSWDEDFLYAAGPNEVEWQWKFQGSKELSTAFAIRALECGLKPD